MVIVRVTFGFGRSCGLSMGAPYLLCSAPHAQTVVLVYVVLLLWDY